MKILVDVDDVTADLVPAWVEQYNKIYQDSLKPEDVKIWKWHELTKVSEGELIEIINNQRFYSHVKPIPGAVEGVKKLRELGHRVIFVTSAMNKHAGAKFRWLTFYGFFDGIKNPQADYVETHDKSLIDGDVIIDDKIENIVFFPKNKMKIIFTREWNSGFSVDGKETFRASSWDDIIDIIKKLEIKIAEKIYLTENQIRLQPKQPTKFDENKLRWDLLPFGALEEVVNIFTIGAKKYGEYNWSRSNGLQWSRVFSAVMRHLSKWYLGEDTDEESKKSHLAHAICGILFLLHYEKNPQKYKIMDDRKKIIEL